MSVLLIDLSSIFWSAWHAGASAEVSFAKQATIDGVRRAVKMSGSRHVAVCCDSGRSFRKTIFADYKAQRPEKDHAAIGELAATKERLEADGMLLWEAKDFEADDVIATAFYALTGPLMEKAIGKLDIVIATADKDLLQLGGPRLAMLSTNKWVVAASEEIVEQKFGGIKPKQVGDWLALVGDTSDNIPGCPGVGAKTATELLKTHQTISGIYEALDTLDASALASAGFKPAVAEKLKAHRDQVILSRQLVELRDDVPIKIQQIFEERAPKPLIEEVGNMDEDAQEHIEAEMDEPQGTRIETPPSAPAEEAARPPGATPSVPQPSTALATQQPSREMALQPMSPQSAWKLAQHLHNSRLYTRFQTPEAIMAVMIRGSELGLGVMTALDCFHVIEGKPAPHAWLIVARAKAHPDCEYFQLVESTGESATWETKNRRNPKPTRLTYTLEQAKRAGLVRGGGNWDKRPDEMCRKTAAAQLARAEYPDAAMGLYSIEEVSE